MKNVTGLLVFKCCIYFIDNYPFKLYNIYIIIGGETNGLIRLSTNKNNFTKMNGG